MPIIKAPVSSGGTTSTSGTGSVFNGTSTITHNLGRTPVVIRIQGLTSFTANASGVSNGVSFGTYNSSGNTCMYIDRGTATVNTATSTSFCVRFQVGGAIATGVIQNVTSTTFDIVWTGGAGIITTEGKYLWEAQ